MRTGMSNSDSRAQKTAPRRPGVRYSAKLRARSSWHAEPTRTGTEPIPHSRLRPEWTVVLKQMKTNRCIIPCHMTRFGSVRAFSRVIIPVAPGYGAEKREERTESRRPSALRQPRSPRMLVDPPSPGPAFVAHSGFRHALSESIFSTRKDRLWSGALDEASKCRRQAIHQLAGRP